MDHGSTVPRVVVGREEELATLRSALDRVRGGAGELVLVRGEAGIGKSTLVEAFCDEARSQDLAVLVGAGWDEGGAPTYWPWVQVMRRAAAVGAAPVIDGFGAALSPLWPGAGEASDRFSLYEAVTLVLDSVADTAPVVVVLEDLHAAGCASALMLEFVARHCRHTRLLLVATYRDAEARLDPELSTVVERLAALAVVLAPRPFTRAEVEALMSGAPADLVDQVLTRTQGNPLFVTHVLRQLDSDIPAGLRQAVRGRAERVAGVPAALDVAAVLGGEIRVGLVADVLEASPDAVAQTFEEAVRADLLGRAEEDRYTFTHSLVRDVLYDGQRTTHRAALHLAVGRALAADPHVAAPTLARHFLAGWPVGGATEAVRYATAAGDGAVAALAYEDAVAHYRQAIVALGRSTEDTAEERVDLLLALVSALQRSGRLAEAGHEADLAAELAARLDDPERYGAAALLRAEHLDFNAVDETAIDLLHRADRAWAGAATPTRGRVLARLAVASTLADRKAAADHALAAVSVAEACGDPSTLAVALSAQLYVAWGEHEPHEALAAAARIGDLGRNADDSALTLDGEMWRLVFALECGDLDQAGAVLVELDRIAADLRRPTVLHLALSRRSTLRALRGRLSDARDLAREAWELGRRCGLPDADAVYWGQLFSVWRFGGLDEDDAAHMERMLVELVEHSRLRAAHEAALVLILIDRGEHDDARTRFARMIAELPDLRHDMVYVWTLSLLASGAAALGDRDAAAVLYPALTPFAGRFAVPAGAVSCLGSVELSLAQLAALTGDDEAARQHFQAAVTAHREADVPAWLALSCLEYATFLGNRGQQARSMADEGERLARVHRLPALLTGRTEADAITMAREGDVWTVRQGTVVVRLPRSRGLAHLAELIRNPGQDIAAEQLVGLLAGPGGTVPDLDVHAGSTSDVVLDATARAAYRRRLRDLDEEIDEAASWHDPERKAGLEVERDFLVRELAAAVGLGGRPRRLGSDAERARVNVTRAIRTAIRRIADQAPELGATLDAAVRTGTHCRYECAP
ncbi:BREX system ATP-binding domain-containing protein [Kutzneria buriramensis]|uniref:AAA ATPase-like protein n=1 Tax=Kutzneria buriramensis TaxID=1045776 RepID=A0A3E0GVG3_9PSEU|nr:BREX system ATP-binding domain-containing protein [Kutzneria buriramensis]REH27646.1 AAA ATPase-like protein [Kutzneria buriramensis]